MAHHATRMTAGRTRAGVLAGCLLALIAPVAARAANVTETTTSAGDGEIHAVDYVAQPGEVNLLDVGLVHSAAGLAATFADAGAAASFLTGGGCTGLAAAVSCAYPAGGRDELRVETGDRNDQLTLTQSGGAGAGEPLSASFELGSGDDRASSTVAGMSIGGGTGNDAISGFRFAFGGAGNDTLTGTSGDDELSGDAGADHVRGLGGDDLLDVTAGELNPGDCGAGADAVTVAAVRRAAAPGDCEQIALGRLATIGAAGRVRGARFLLAYSLPVRTVVAPVQLRGPGGAAWGRGTRPATLNAGRAGTLRLRLTPAGRAALVRGRAGRAVVVVGGARRIRAVLRVTR